MNRLLLPTALALAATATLGLLEANTAEANVRFSGGGRVHVRAHGGVSINYSRPAYRPYYGRSWGVSGRIYVGGRYNYGYYPRYYYPYPRYYYYYTPVPSYYGVYSQSYYPVAPAPQPAVAQPAVVVAPKPELPKLGIGLFAGGASVEGADGFDRKDSSDVGLLGRLRLTPGLLIEAEIGKTSYENDLRVDRRMGASLVYEIGAYNKLAPYVLAGLGVQQAEVGDGQFETTQNYGELGIGLRYAVTPRFHILFDVRAGSRNTVSSDQMPNTDVATRSVTPPTESSPDQSENYTRGRLAAVLNF